MHVMQLYSSNSTLARSRRLAARQLLLPTAAVPAAGCTRSPLSVRCQARRTTAAKGRSTVKTRKGFGPGPVKQQEPWEAQLLSCYKVYYKPSFKPSRYQGPIELQKFPGSFTAAFDFGCCGLLQPLLKLWVLASCVCCCAYQHDRLLDSCHLTSSIT